MRIARIDQALEECENHLSSTSTFGTEIESLLTCSLLVIMCAEFEQKVESIVQEKCLAIDDLPLRQFIGSCVGAVFRSVKSSEIAGLLNRFSPNHKERFNKQAAANERAVTFYNNIVVNRHSTAHSDQLNVTFREAKQFYEEGHIVLDFLSETLLVSHLP